VPPHKPRQAITGAAHRLAMIELAIAGNAAFAVSRVELDRPGPSYTVDTLEALAADGTDLTLILSAEAFAGLPSWREPERVLGMARLAVAPRDGYAELGPSFLEERFPGVRTRVVFLDGPRIRLSASELRDRAAAGRSLRYLVPDAVAAYIGDHGLYRTDRRDDRT
jgi:nicotinate-nucleotide adenylyltransferase